MDPEEEIEEINEIREIKRPPAVTLTVESWATPLVGLLMLILGLVGGYFLRPVLAREAGQLAQATAVPIPTSAPSDQTSGQTGEVQIPNPLPAEAVDPIVAATRHFLGEEDATITIIEFSDFQ